jgi:hypothetical protein
MTQNKEQLLVELTRIRQTQEEWVAGDLKRRKEFARAFGWNKAKKQFDYGDVELYEPSWIEIFVELGKLLSAKNFMDFEGNVSELECKLEDIEKVLINKK